jgi:hypothetical protein
LERVVSVLSIGRHVQTLRKHVSARVRRASGRRVSDNLFADLRDALPSGQTTAATNPASRVQRAADNLPAEISQSVASVSDRVSRRPGLILRAPRALPLRSSVRYRNLTPRQRPDYPARDAHFRQAGH